jgi:ribonucleoside-diphosphate reductase alpha chain
MNKAFEDLSRERKELQAKGHLPDWFTTQGWQMFKEKYFYEPDAVYGRHKTIAKTLAKQLPHSLREHYEQVFFDLMWSGKLSPATPVLANCGTDRGLTVSCSGQYIDDSIDSFYANMRETAILSQYAFGTSGDFSSVRPRGSAISKGGSANGVRTVIDDFFTATGKVSQGGNRRGSFAAYLDIEHPDFDECYQDLFINSNGKNYGWVIKDSFIEKLKAGDPEANRRFTEVLYLKVIHGKGYFFFVDKANRHRPEMYKEHGLDIKASNLCSEIMLHSGPDYTYSCILSSINLMHWDQIENDNTIFDATVFLDCVTSDFLEKSKGIPGLEKVRAFTEKGRAIGLGVMGLHSMMQSKSIAFDSLQGMTTSNLVFQRLQEESLRASQWMATVLGEPDWCKGYGVRNTHRTAQAPTKSTALLMGGVSEGINPDPGMVFESSSAVGELTRITPIIYELMKNRGVYNTKTIKRIIDNVGSVQQEDWLSAHEKEVFKTAFEINQETILNMAAARQNWLCQGQSLNFYFPETGSEKLLARLITLCFLNENILSQYYIYSRNGVIVNDECLSCSA